MMSQFILTLQTNIRAKVNAIVNVNVDKVALGSILVSNTATFTDADSDTATAGQDALAKVLKSGDLTGIFGTQYGDVTVTDVTKGNSGNPSRSNACYLLLYVLVRSAISISIVASCGVVATPTVWILSDFVICVRSSQWSCKGRRHHMGTTCSSGGSHLSHCPVIANGLGEMTSRDNSHPDF